MSIFSKSLYSRVAAVFLVALCGAGSVVYFVEQAQIQRRQRAAMEVAAAHGYLLQEQTNRSLSATYALAAVLKQGGGEIDQFDVVAAGMLPLYGGISALQLAPGGIIRQIHPLAGNEAAIGHDLLGDPSRNKEAFAALETRQLTLAGPFTLRQGGEAVVGRLPVFLRDRNKGEYFWGFATALIRIPDLLAASHLGEAATSGYAYALSRVHPDTQQREVFWSSTTAMPAEPIGYALRVPNGTWLLEIAPLDGWHSSLPILAMASLGALVFGALSGLLAYRIFREPLLLAREVEARTRELRLANESLEAEIVEHWQAELALRDSERRLEGAVEARTQALSEANTVLQVESLQQKALLEEFEAAQEQASHIEMMASMGQLSTGLAHQVGEPLARVESHLALLRREGETLAPDLRRGALDDALCGVARLRELVDDLKAFSHVDEADWQLLDLNRALACSLKVLAWERVQKVDVVTEFGSIPAIECHAFQINQLFFNLLHHAEHDLAEIGVMRVRTWEAAHSVVIEIAGGVGDHPPGTDVSGETGLPAEAPDTGSGLALARGIAARHGGRVEVAACSVSGRVFRVWLPIMVGGQ